MAEIAESETDNQPDPLNGPQSNSHFITKENEEKMDIHVDNSVTSTGTMDNRIPVPSAGPDGDNMEVNSNGPRYDDIKISNDGDNFVNIDTVKKPFSDFIHLDNLSATSGDSGGKQDSNSNASMTASGTSSSKSPNHKPDKEKGHIGTTPVKHVPNTGVVDHAKKEKEKEREERIRSQREKLAEERQKKMEEMREQQRQAQEKREKQLELRRLKIEELKRRDEERRQAVEERRRKQETEEMARRESIIQKSHERITRFEQWKASGRKGGSRFVYGFGSRTPRDVCVPFDRRRSSSHTGLSRHSPNGSDSDYYRPQRRAVSACSAVRRHCCIDINRLTGTFGGGAPPNKQLSMSTSVLYNKRSSDFNGSTGNLGLKDRPGSLLALNTISEKRRSFLAGNGPPPTRPRSSVNLSTKENVKLRERSTPRKPRPSSVATSMPSFMHVESPSPKMRSKSSDRVAKDKPKGPIPPQPKFTPKKDKDALNKQEKQSEKKDERKKFDPRKSLAEKRKAEQQKKAEEEKKEGTPEKSDKPAIKISQKSIDRLSAPKQVKAKADTPTKPTEPPKTPNVKKSPAASRTKSPAATRTKSPAASRSRTKSPEATRPKSSAATRTKSPAVSRTKSPASRSKSPSKQTKPIKQKGKENKETPAKDSKWEKISSTEKLDKKETIPVTPTKQAKTNKDGSPAKLQVSFDSSIMSSTDAAEQLFESIEDETLPSMEDSSQSETSGKTADNLDDSINKEVEEIVDTEVVAGNIDGENVEEGAEQKSPTPDVVPITTEEKKDEGEIEKEAVVPAILVSENDFEPAPAVTSTPAKLTSDLISKTGTPAASTPAKEVTDLSAKTGTPASTSKSQKELELEEYRAKLAEKRRQAREKAEREAELERQRQEQIQREEEEREKREEEEQKRIEEEAERLAEEARRIEGERLRKAIEAEEQRKREEAERAEQERLAREEAEKKQKEESERMEKERVEKIKREEEERNERKKKLAAIMSKVKSDKNLAGSDSNLSLSSMAASSQSLTNLATSEDEQTEENLQVADSAPKFKSPLLQKLVENKQNGSGGSETPKFKSPLLQSLLGKKGRLADKLESDKSESNTNSCDTKPPSEEREIIEISADSHSDNSDNSDNSVINTDETIKNGLHNGDVPHIKEMVDSSISMRTVDSLGTSVTTDSSLYGSLTDSTEQTDHKLEQIIDLSVTNAKYNTSEDLLNCNTNNTYQEGEETLPKPIIAFEDNATRRQEVADCL